MILTKFKNYQCLYKSTDLIIRKKEILKSHETLTLTITLIHLCTELKVILYTLRIYSC
jgi:hypothetical protein